MTDTPKAEWRNGYEFAEMAETLGIRTTQIMAAQVGQGRAWVVYTPELDEDDLDPGTPLYLARLERDADKILRVVGEPMLTEFDWTDLEAAISKALDEHLA